MEYKTFKPSKELSAFIKCYWILEGAGDANSEKQTIVPDGCMEMIFHYGDLYKQYDVSGNSFLQPRCFVFGQLTRPLEIEPTGETGIFSVRFKHNGFLPFTTFSLKEMENRPVELEVLFGESGKLLENTVLNESSTKQKIILVEKFLLDKVKNQEKIDNIIKSTVDTILTANGQIKVEELTSKTKTSRRQLERKFSHAIGLSPKKLSKTIRLQTTLNMLINNKFTSLTALAYENDYYDQAHFIKDFKELTGFTPKEFYGDNLRMSILFYGKE